MNIDEYRTLITKKYPHFSTLKIESPAHELEFQPWLSWASSVNPPWWKGYNSVKHERSKYYSEANLGNVLESAAGLLVLLVYFHQPVLYAENQLIVPDFKTMRIEAQYAHLLHFGVDYSLPDFGKSYPES